MYIFISLIRCYRLKWSDVFACMAKIDIPERILFHEKFWLINAQN